MADRLCELGLPTPVEPFACSNEQFDQATANLVLVAICHQTQELGGEVDGRKIRGWDYLQASMLKAAQNDTAFLSPISLSQVSQQTLARVLQCGDQLSPADLTRRAAIIQNCGQTMIEAGYANATEIHESCEHRISGPEPNLLGELSAFEAFRDPVKKKSLYFLGLNQSTCGWRYADPKSLLPPVDYHEIRGHLRLGTVRILDQYLRTKIENREGLNERDDVAIRTAVTEAITRIAELTQMSPMQLHYGFWNLFRNVCVRRAPLCSRCKSDSLPRDYQHLTMESCCPFMRTCDSVGLNPAIDEYVFKTEWY